MNIKNLFKQAVSPDADIREQQVMEHKLRQERERETADARGEDGTDPDRHTKFQTLLENRAQACDWLDGTPNLIDKDAPRARVFVRTVGDSMITLGVELSGGVRGHVVSGDFTPTRAAIEPDGDGLALLDLEQYLHGGWDWLQLAFGSTCVDVIVSRAWYRKLALTVRAPQSIIIRKTKAPG